MNSFTVNSAALNDGGSLASIVYLPSANLYLAWEMDEWLSAEVSGDTTFGIDALGYITSFISPGTGVTELAINITGDLAAYRRIYFDLSEIQVSIDLTGDIATGIIGPNGECFTDITLSGELALTQVLTGNTEFGFALSGDAVSTLGLPVSEVTLSVDPTGTLQLVGGLYGDASFNIDSTGTITQGIAKYINSSTASFGFESTGVLRLTGGLIGNTLWNLDSSANLTKGISTYFDQSNSDFSLTPTGSIRLTGGLFGNSLSTITLTGILTKQEASYLPEAVVSFKMDTSSYLSGIFRMQGDSLITINASGALSRFSQLSANSVWHIDLQGSLSSNLGALDLEKLLMHRPKTNKEMTR